jgi:hypothetical protein
MTEYRNLQFLCEARECLNRRLQGSPFCKTHTEEFARLGYISARCRTPGCFNDACSAFGEEYCHSCLNKIGTDPAIAGRVPVAADPRIAKLKAVADDPSATAAEKETALALISKISKAVLA